MLGDLINLFLRYAESFKPLRGILGKIVDEGYLLQVQSNILHYSLNNDKTAFKLPCMLVTRPVGAHMIQLARIFTEILKFNCGLVVSVSTNCWSTFVLWFFVFKNNGMISNIICSTMELFFEHAEEKKIKEVLIDKKFLGRFIEVLSAKPNSEEKDFFSCCKRTARKIYDYAESHKTKFTRDILNIPTWKALFPPVQETVSRIKPISRSCKRGHTFILGLDPLEKAAPKAAVKNDYEIEHLASQLDLIYRINS